MEYIEYGTEHEEAILLLHGGGLAPWQYEKEEALLQEEEGV